MPPPFGAITRVTGSAEADPAPARLIVRAARAMANLDMTWLLVGTAPRIDLQECPWNAGSRSIDVRVAAKKQPLDSFTGQAMALLSDSHLADTLAPSAAPP